MQHSNKAVSTLKVKPLGQYRYQRSTWNNKHSTN